MGLEAIEEIEDVAVVEAEEVLQEVQIVDITHLHIVVEVEEEAMEVTEEAEAVFKTTVILDRLEDKEGIAFNHRHLMIKITEVKVEVIGAEVLLAMESSRDLVVEVEEVREAVDRTTMTITPQPHQPQPVATETKFPTLVKPMIETTDQETMIKDTMIMSLLIEV